MSEERPHRTENRAGADARARDGARHRDAEIARLRLYRPGPAPPAADSAEVVALVRDWERDGSAAIEWP
ncbi:hypothetical protein ACFWXK_21165 [Streptomyces sp. NPDC059070]|uniref:hypothetical protein n=1 Tax=unclassified Streptomyces TaxID=2593676 RepID=UPI0034E25C23